MNRLVRPVLFAFEPDVVTVACQINFGASGAPTLTALNSKGFCNVAQTTKTFTAAGTSSTSMTSVSDFTGLYLGMALSGTNVGVGALISAMNAGAGTMTASVTSSGAISSVTATGGYTLTLGSQFTPFKRLDAYNKLLGFSYLWDLSGLPGAAATQASTPAGPEVFLVGNNVSNGSLASISFQTGTYNGAGATFKSVNPANGEILRMVFQLVRSSAI